MTSATLQTEYMMCRAVVPEIRLRRDILGQQQSGSCLREASSSGLLDASPQARPWRNERITSTFLEARSSAHKVSQKSECECLFGAATPAVPQSRPPAPTNGWQQSRGRASGQDSSPALLTQNAYHPPDSSHQTVASPSRFHLPLPNGALHINKKSRPAPPSNSLGTIVAVFRSFDCWRCKFLLTTRSPFAFWSHLVYHSLLCLGPLTWILLTFPALGERWRLWQLGRCSVSFSSEVQLLERQRRIAVTTNML